MTTLVTGHGLVGARAVALLRQRGEDVVVYDLAPPQGPGIVPVAGDLLDLGALATAVRRHRPELILHTAGLLTPAGESRPYDTAQVNVTGTLNVLEAARIGAVPRVVFTSSVVVYDASVATDRVVEDHPCAPRTVYAATKLAAELLGRAFARSTGLTFLTLRFAAVYGPTARPGGGVSRVIHDALRTAIASGRASVRRRWPGHQELIYAEDAAAALVAAGFVAAPRHDTFNIGSGEPVTVDELAVAIGDIVGAKVTVVDPRGDANPHVIRGALDLGRARDELGWRPAYNLRRGLAEHAAWLRAGSRARDLA